MRVGLFELVDPPEGQVEVIRDLVVRIDYPWHRLIPRIRTDPDQAVVVRWVKDQNLGLYFDRNIEIHLSTQYTHSWERSVPFTFAHEVGHLVDFATLTEDDRADLLALMHEKDESRYAGQEDPNNPGEPHPWSHDRDHPERWESVQRDYLFRPREAYADLFVAAFAPSLWEGKSPRFVHWTDDLQAVRDITLRRPIMAFTDVPEDHPHREGIEWAAGQGLIQGYPDGTFRPEQPLTRGQYATIKKREHDANL